MVINAVNNTCAVLICYPIVNIQDKTLHSNASNQWQGYDNQEMKNVLIFMTINKMSNKY